MFRGSGFNLEEEKKEVKGYFFIESCLTQVPGSENRQSQNVVNDTVRIERFVSEYELDDKGSLYDFSGSNSKRSKNLLCIDSSQELITVQSGMRNYLYGGECKVYFKDAPNEILLHFKILPPRNQTDFLKINIIQQDRIERSIQRLDVIEKFKFSDFGLLGDKLKMGGYSKEEINTINESIFAHFGILGFSMDKYFFYKFEDSKDYAPSSSDDMYNYSKFEQFYRVYKNVFVREMQNCTRCQKRGSVYYVRRLMDLLLSLKFNLENREFSFSQFQQDIFLEFYRSIKNGFIDKEKNSYYQSFFRRIFLELYVIHNMDLFEKGDMLFRFISEVLSEVCDDEIKLFSEINQRERSYSNGWREKVSKRVLGDLKKNITSGYKKVHIDNKNICLLRSFIGMRWLGYNGRFGVEEEAELIKQVLNIREYISWLDRHTQGGKNMKNIKELLVEPFKLLNYCELLQKGSIFECFSEIVSQLGGFILSDQSGRFGDGKKRNCKFVSLLNFTALEKFIYQNRSHEETGNFYNGLKTFLFGFLKNLANFYVNDCCFSENQVNCLQDLYVYLNNYACRGNENSYIEEYFNARFKEAFAQSHPYFKFFISGIYGEQVELEKFKLNLQMEKLKRIKMENEKIREDVLVERRKIEKEKEMFIEERKRIFEEEKRKRENVKSTETQTTGFDLNEFETEKSSLEEEQIRLKNEIEKIKEELENKNIVIDDLESSNQYWEKESSLAKKELDEKEDVLNKEIEKQKSLIERLLSDVKTREREVEKLKIDKKSEFEELKKRIGTFEEQVKILMIDNERLVSENNLLSDSLSLEKKKDDVDGKEDENKISIDEVEFRRMTSEIKYFREELKKKESMLDSIQEENTRIFSELSELKETVNELEEKNTKIHNENIDLKHNVSDIEGEKEELEKEIEELKSNLLESGSEKRELERKISDVEEDLLDSKDKIVELKGINDSLEKELHEEKRKAEEMEEKHGYELYEKENEIKREMQKKMEEEMHKKEVEMKERIAEGNKILEKESQLFNSEMFVGLLENMIKLAEERKLWEEKAKSFDENATVNIESLEKEDEDLDSDDDEQEEDDEEKIDFRDVEKMKMQMEEYKMEILEERQKLTVMRITRKYKDDDPLYDKFDDDLDENEDDMIPQVKDNDNDDESKVNLESPNEKENENEEEKLFGEDGGNEMLFSQDENVLDVKGLGKEGGDVTDEKFDEKFDLFDDGFGGGSHESESRLTVENSFENFSDEFASSVDDVEISNEKKEEFESKVYSGDSDDDEGNVEEKNLDSGLEIENGNNVVVESSSSQKIIKETEMEEKKEDIEDDINEAAEDEPKESTKDQKKDDFEFYKTKEESVTEVKEEETGEEKQLENEEMKSKEEDYSFVESEKKGIDNDDDFVDGKLSGNSSDSSSSDEEDEEDEEDKDLQLNEKDENERKKEVDVEKTKKKDEDQFIDDGYPYFGNDEQEKFENEKKNDLFDVDDVDDGEKKLKDDDDIFVDDEDNEEKRMDDDKDGKGDFYDDGGFGKNRKGNIFDEYDGEGFGELQKLINDVNGGEEDVKITGMSLLRRDDKDEWKGHGDDVDDEEGKRALEEHQRNIKDKEEFENLEEKIFLNKQNGEALLDELMGENCCYDDEDDSEMMQMKQKKKGSIFGSKNKGLEGEGKEINIDYGGSGAYGEYFGGGIGGGYMDEVNNDFLTQYGGENKKNKKKEVSQGQGGGDPLLSSFDRFEAYISSTKKIPLADDDNNEEENDGKKKKKKGSDNDLGLGGF